MAGIRLLPAERPLLRLPRLTASDEEMCEAALRAASDPGEVWRAFRTARRSARSGLTRLRARVDETYRTTTPEYLDRDDVSARRRERIIEALDLTHRILGTHQRFCRLALPQVEGIAEPRILEVASGHGKLAITLERTLAARGVRASVVGSDIAPELVALAQQNGRAAGSAVSFVKLDATRLDVADDSFDLVVNALSMHHLPFEMLVRALSEMRRVSKRAVIFDLWRAPALFLPSAVVMLAFSLSLDCTHDGIISMRKAWGVPEWRLAAELAGWRSMSIGLSLPAFVLVKLER